MQNFKMKFTILVLTMSIVFFSSALVFAEGEITDSDAVSMGINKFAYNLYDKIKDSPEIKKNGGNLFFSPYSISAALGMTYTGARGNTAKEMADVLQLPPLELEKIAAAYGQLQNQLQANPKTSEYQLNIANALWGQKGYNFLPEFLEINKKYFDSGLTELDFAKSEEARKIINTWVEDKTKEKIKDLITPGALDPLTRLVLTNAIYFKGNWAVQFKEENTKPADFNVTENKKVEVPMMHQKGKYFYGESDTIQVLQMPYKGEELAMFIVLPKAGVSLSDVEKQINSESPYIFSSISRSKQGVEVFLPKFKMTCGTIALKEILIAMGMKDAFSSIADFSGMTGKRDLFISAVMHKAFVEVNEEGTEAAAATAVIMQKDEPRPTPVFRADRPFIFMITDIRGQNDILFMGRLVDPTLKSE
ncbi:MAG: serpin family protein [Sedimentisphaerales bacterium]|nr:serpin family protein [Sedimentisphaerales bacterium]